MKKLALCLCVFLLCGCQVNHETIKDHVEEELILSSIADPIYYTTMNKPLYSYYLPKDVGRISANELSSLFVKDGVKFIMNFNPNAIVIHDYYHDDVVKMQRDIEVNSKDIYFEAKGSFKGSDARYHDYVCQIFDLQDGNLLLRLDMEYVNYLANLKPTQLESMIHSMFVMAKSMKFDSSEVIALYSLKSTSDKILQDLEEYNEEIENNGMLSDLIERTKKK